jgi:hypothetical protein
MWLLTYRHKLVNYFSTGVQLPILQTTCLIKDIIEDVMHRSYHVDLRSNIDKHVWYSAEPTLIMTNAEDCGRLGTFY